MAQEKENKANAPVPTDKYQGPSKLGTAFGGFMSWGGLSAAITSPISHFGLNPLLLKESDKLHDAYDMLKEQADKLDKVADAVKLTELNKGMQSINDKFKGLTGKSNLINGALLAGVAILGIFGAVIGWNKAKKAKEQFDTLKTERDSGVAKNEALQSQVAGLNQEAGEHRRNFTDMHKSRTEQGNHGDLAKMMKDLVSNAEAAR